MGKLPTATIASFTSIGLTLVLAVVGAAFVTGGRLQSPEEKRAMVEDIVAPIVSEVNNNKNTIVTVEDRIDAHRETIGHPGMGERVSGVQTDIAEIKTDLREIKEDVKELLKRKSNGGG